jgi:hypothetical protein
MRYRTAVFYQYSPFIRRGTPFNRKNNKPTAPSRGIQMGGYITLSQQFSSPPSRYGSPQSQGPRHPGNLPHTAGFYHGTSPLHMGGFGYSQSRGPLHPGSLLRMGSPGYSQASVERVTRHAKSRRSSRPSSKGSDFSVSAEFQHPFRRSSSRASAVQAGGSAYHIEDSRQHYRSPRRGNLPPFPGSSRVT